jgi:hypothetical protein
MAPGQARSILRHYRHSFGRLCLFPPRMSEGAAAAALISE